MKKILIVNLHYNIGGIRKALDNFVDYLSKDNQVDLLFLTTNKDCLSFLNKNNVRLINTPVCIDALYTDRSTIKTKKNRLLYYLLKLKYRIECFLFGTEKTIENSIDKSKGLEGEYDIAISYFHDQWSSGEFYGGCNYYVKKKVHSKKKYSWIHGEMSNICLDRTKAIKTYDGFNKVITVSKACDAEFKLITGGLIPSDYIYNFFNIEDILKKGNEIVDDFVFDKFTFVTVGRIHPIKRIDRVNQIAKIMKEKGYLFSWIVIGGGSSLDNYVEDTKKQGLSNIVFFVGERKNPYKYIKKSNVLVHLSDSEAFSTVINESLILETPVISTDFQSASESIHSNKNGYIVESTVESIANKMMFIIDNNKDYLSMKKYLKQNDWGRYLNCQFSKKIKNLIN